MKADIKLIAGNSNRALADAIAAYLEVPLARCQVRRFADMAGPGPSGCCDHYV